MEQKPVKPVIVAIDGPAGSGKSTVSKLIAKKMSYIYIDTGAMYRAVALYCIKNKIDMNSEQSISEILPEIDIQFEKSEQDNQRVILNGEDVSLEIRTPQVAAGSSQVAVYKCVRDFLVPIQRKYGESFSVVMDGRDIGTAVFPNALVKIFLTADIKSRAKRRALELESVSGGSLSDEMIRKTEEELFARDENDMNRANSPLKKAEDAIEIDTSNMTIEQVAAKIISIISTALEKRA